MNEVLHETRKNRIFYVPKIRRIRIKNIGLWKDVLLEFADGMNVITGVTASGKSTVLKCILSGISGNETLLEDLAKQKNSRIEIEPAGKSMALEIGGCFASENVNAYSSGEILYNKLLGFINKTNKGYALLIDGIMDRLSKDMFEKTLDLLQKTENQKIIITKRYEGIVNARIFECIQDAENNSSGILVRDV